VNASAASAHPTPPLASNQNEKSSAPVIANAKSA